MNTAIYPNKKEFIRFEILNRRNATGAKNSIEPSDILKCFEYDIKSLYSEKEGTLILIKMLKEYTVGRIKNLTKQTITLTFQNEDKETYPDMEIKICDIEKIYLVDSIMIDFKERIMGENGKQGEIDYLIYALETNYNDERSIKLAQSLRHHRYKSLSELRTEIDKVLSETKSETKWSLGIKDTLFNIDYTYPEWGWE